MEVKLNFDKCLLENIQKEYDAGLTWHKISEIFKISESKIYELTKSGLLKSRSKSECHKLKWNRDFRNKIKDSWTKEKRSEQSHKISNLIKEGKIKRTFNPLNLTYPERLAYNYLKTCNIDFEPQFNIDRFWVDFLIIKNNLIIEIDGEAWHKDKDYDENRDKIIKSYGYDKIIRIPASDVIPNMENIFGVYNVTLNLDDIKNESIIVKRKTHMDKINITKEELSGLIKIKTTREIGEMFNVHSFTVCKKCKLFGIDIPKRRGEWHKIAFDLYKNGEKISQISKILNINRKIIANLFRTKYKKPTEV